MSIVLLLQVCKSIESQCELVRSNLNDDDVQFLYRFRRPGADEDEESLEWRGAQFVVLDFLVVRW